MRLTEQAHKEISKFLLLGDMAIDATAGNGHDTKFLTQKVGINGRVFAFDRQKESIERTHSLLERENLLTQVSLFPHCHSTISKKIPSEFKGKIKVCTFNLGYLPTGDKTIITEPQSTISALIQSYEYLSDDGIISILAYRGHPGGKEEFNKIEELIFNEKWARKQFSGNERAESPVLSLIIKS